ncbi:hypothetical protein RhiJN_20716 [Ceratobasidium sp. AG-Ba]|nr:hypothetical protein RhiJN_20716 [Ceratobasidium sp. AG-Ba]
MRVSLDLSIPLATGGSQACVPNLPPEMILKVYDRRFAYSLRRQYMLDPATYASKATYRRYLRSDRVHDLESLCKTVSKDYYSYKECQPEFLEHIIMFKMEPYFEDERAAYERLAHLQGIDIPIFYGTTQFLDGLSVDDLDPPIPGVLLEVVPGIALDSLDVNSVDLDSVVRNAIRIVDT